MSWAWTDGTNRAKRLGKWLGSYDDRLRGDDRFHLGVRSAAAAFGLQPLASTIASANAAGPRRPPREIDVSWELRGGCEGQYT